MRTVPFFRENIRTIVTYQFRLIPVALHFVENRTRCPLAPRGFTAAAILWTQKGFYSFHRQQFRIIKLIFFRFRNNTSVVVLHSWTAREAIFFKLFFFFFLRKQYNIIPRSAQDGSIFETSRPCVRRHSREWIFWCSQKTKKKRFFVRGIRHGSRDTLDNCTGALRRDSSRIRVTVR